MKISRIMLLIFCIIFLVESFKNQVSVIEGLTVALLVLIYDELTDKK